MAAAIEDGDGDDNDRVFARSTVLSSSAHSATPVGFPVVLEYSRSFTVVYTEVYVSCCLLPGKDIALCGHEHGTTSSLLVRPIVILGCELRMIARRIGSSLSFSLLKRPHIRIAPRTMSTKTIAVLDHGDLKDGQMYGPNRAAHSRQ
jgi:hypothetical protein